MSKTGVENVADNLEKLSIDPKGEKSTNFIEALSNMTEDEMIRGTRPENVEKQCLELCQAYIGGSWLQTEDPSDVTVTRITGGLTNQLYKCSLNDSVKRVGNVIYPNEPVAVAIKLYQSKHMQNFKDGEDERLSDTISLTILGQTGIGPKIYGIFSGGVIQEFIEHEQFTLKYQKQPDKLCAMVDKLARFHHLKVPISKTHNWVVEETQKHLKVAFAERNAQALIEELKCENLLKYDIHKEHEKLMVYLEALNSPLVFTHFDFRGSNILVRKSDEEILFVDAEYCGYSYRAYDLFTYLHEWGHETMDFEKHGLPTDEIIEAFVQLYIDGCNKVVPGYASMPENSLETIVKEVKFISLLSYMLFVCWTMQSTKGLLEVIAFDKKENMKFAEQTYVRYLEYKQRLIDDGTLKE